MIDAERAVIGCLIMDIENMDKVYDSLSAQMFEDEKLGSVYQELRKAYDSDENVDITIIVSRLGMIGIEEELAECVEKITMSVEIVKYADEVIKCYKARQLSKLIQFKPDGSVIDKQISDLETQLQVLSDGKKDNSMSIGDLAETYRGSRFIENRKQGIKTGISELDKIIQGMDDGDLILIASRPAVGKTAFGTQIALNTSKTVETALISLEMTNEQLYDRIIAHESGIELNRIRRACSCMPMERDMFEIANDSLKSKKLTLVDDINTVSGIYAFLKRHRIRVAVIDYAQLIRPEGRYRGNRYAEVGEISHGLKNMAKKLNIPVILLTQLNRVADETKEPTMGEIRESGDFEQDASIIILLWNKSDDRTQKGVKVDKNRSGETGKIELFFDGKIMKFSEYKKAENNPFG